MCRRRPCELVGIGLSVLLLCSCSYEESPCEKAYEIQATICSGHPECLLCKCINEGRLCRLNERTQFIQIGGYVIPDFSRPGLECRDTSDCEGSHKEYAENCVEDESYCNNWMYVDTDIYLCDPGVMESFGFNEIECNTDL